MSAIYDLLSLIDMTLVAYENGKIGEAEVDPVYELGTMAIAFLREVAEPTQYSTTSGREQGESEQLDDPGGPASEWSLDRWAYFRDLAGLAYEEDHQDDARRLVTQAEEVIEQLEDLGGRLELINKLMEVSYGGDDQDTARRLVAKANKTIEKMEDPRREQELVNLAGLVYNGGDRDIGRELVEQIKNPRTKAWGFSVLANCALSEDDKNTARQFLRQAEEIGEQIEDPEAKAWVFSVLAESAYWDDENIARQFLRQAEEAIDQIEDPETEALVFRDMIELANTFDDQDTARRLVTQTEETIEQMEDKKAKSRISRRIEEILI